MRPVLSKRALAVKSLVYRVIAYGLEILIAYTAVTLIPDIDFLVGFAAVMLAVNVMKAGFYFLYDYFWLHHRLFLNVIGRSLRRIKEKDVR